VHMLVTDGSFVNGAGVGLLLVGAAALFLGLFAVVEPPEGWRSARRPQERRSLLAQAVEASGRLESPTTGGLAVWGLLVGGGLLILGTLALEVAG
jgi:hypothetical protein